MNAMEENRAQYAAEQVLTDSSLTDSLDDAAANVLINWAVTAAKRIADTSQGMEGENAQAYIDMQMRGIRRVMRRTNRLIGRMDELSDEELGDGITRILEGCTDVVVMTPRPVSNMDRMVRSLRAAKPTDAVRQLTQQIIVSGQDRPRSKEQRGVGAALLNLLRGKPQIEEVTTEEPPTTDDAGSPPEEPHNKQDSQGE